MQRWVSTGLLVAIGSLLSSAPCLARSGNGPDAGPGVSCKLVDAHKWLPPFGLDRVGQSKDLLIQLDGGELSAGAFAFSRRSRGVVGREEPVIFNRKPPYVKRVKVDDNSDEVVVTYRAKDSKGAKEVCTAQIKLPKFEADATAAPEEVINPVDLGTILVPSDWLLLRRGQKTKVDLAALTRDAAGLHGGIKVWWKSDPKNVVQHALELKAGEKASKALTVAPYNLPHAKDALTIAIVAKGGAVVWSKTIDAMISSEAATMPSFGVVKTKLRFDAPILNLVKGKKQPFDYDHAWAPELDDYVVNLPNGSRWVFWRGSSYIPFWAGKYNTGLSYEWAERLSPREGFEDCPEPLMDKQLRYGRVEVVENTKARIHVRWGYQSCDFNYKVNGDFAHEDYYFYPDGIGTRVLTLTAIPEADYELEELILIASQGSYPFQVLPQPPLEVISVPTGDKKAVYLPQSDASWKELKDPSIYILKPHVRDPLKAFIFSASLYEKPNIFEPFVEKGEVVTPAYWGGHWPLNQGFNTGWAINESIEMGPSHSSLVSFSSKKPKPLSSKTEMGQDALKAKKLLKTETWAWLIGMTEASDAELLKLARSYAQPAKLTVRSGGKVDSEQHALERRSLNMTVEGKRVVFTLSASRDGSVNPVVELKNAAKAIVSLKVDGNPLPSQDYAWDGKVLWLKMTFQGEKTIELTFG